MPETEIAYASPTGSNLSTCAKQDPCSIQRAFTVADASRSTVYLFSGSYAANVTVANKTVHVRGNGSSLSPTSGTTLTVNDDGVVQVRQLTIISSAALGTAVDVESLNGTSVPSIALEDVQIESAGRGITLRHGHATISRSQIHSSGDSSLSAIDSSTAEIERTLITTQAGYLLVSGTDSSLRLTNSLVRGQSAGGNDDCCFAVGGAISVSFSTLVNVKATCNSDPASCVASPHNGVCLDNSILANFSAGAPPDTMTGRSCVASSSILFPQTVGVLGAANKLNVNPVFVDVTNGDFHLGANSPAVDAADPVATLTTDIEGTMRPVGAAPDMGAYERH